jgi:predicted nuclease with TOPRIM domain
VQVQCNNLKQVCSFGDINRAWENIKENIKIIAKETLDLYKRKQHKPCFDEECSQSLGKRKQAKMQSNVHNMNKTIRERSSNFRKKKKGISES